MECLIIVEGKDDKRFLEDYIQLLGFSHFIEFNLIGGNFEKLESGILDTSFKKRFSKILFITDSDVGFEQQKNYIKKYLQKFDHSPEIFLFPSDTQEESGNLESLLSSIAKIQTFFDCFDPMLECLQRNKKKMSNQNDGKINLPDHHGKMYMYTSLFIKESENANGPKRNYFLNSLWDLNHTALDPLKGFLIKNLS